MNKSHLVILACDPHWLVVNFFNHASIGLDHEGLALLQTGKPDPSRKKYFYWETASFGQEEGLLEDPSRFSRKWGEPHSLSGEELSSLLEKRFFLKQADPSWERKKNVLDHENTGNFHDQLGQHLSLVKKRNPQEWWIDQKFDLKTGKIREGLYREIQEVHTQVLFGKILRPGVRILDLGCGIGYYSKKMADLGAEVCGVDPNEAYIQQAKKMHGTSVRFETASPGRENGLSFLEDASFDHVYMSDALLFYFVPIHSRHEKPDLHFLLEDISRVLSPAGSFISVEPHPCFFMQPWLGDSRFPFTVLSEYKSSRYRIVPTLMEQISAVLSSGFRMIHFEEWYAQNASSRAQSVSFSSEFPLWYMTQYEKGVSD